MFGCGKRNAYSTSLSFQMRTTKGAVRRELGAAQWVRHGSHVHLFVGLSCSTQPRHTSSMDGSASFRPSISIGEAGWNNEDNSFHGAPRIVDGRHCTPCVQLDDGLDALMMTWNRSIPPPQRNLSTFAVYTEGLQCGVPTISLPVLVIRGFWLKACIISSLETS